MGFAGVFLFYLIIILYLIVILVRFSSLKVSLATA